MYELTDSIPLIGQLQSILCAHWLIQTLKHPYLKVYPFAGIADAPNHRTPRLLINNNLVGSFGSRPNDAALLGDIVKNINQLANILDWSEDLLEAQMENELSL